MTSRELRKQRREAERKARKLEYQQNRLAAAATAIGGAGSLAGEPVAGPAFTAAEFAPQTSAPQPPDEPAVLSEAKTQKLDEPAVLSEAKTQKTSGPTGPRTTQGKAVSSGNSLKHGLASGRLIVPGEDPADFEALLEDLLAEHAPATETEVLLVRQMAQSWWLMQRAIRIQNEAFTETRLDEPAVFGEGKTLEIDTHKLALFLRYQTTHERAFYRALNALTKLKQNRARQQAELLETRGRGCPPGQAVVSLPKSHPEFVSQSRPASRFVSRNAPHPESEAEFVSQNGPVGKTIAAISLTQAK